MVEGEGFERESRLIRAVGGTQTRTTTSCGQRMSLPYECMTDPLLFLLQDGL